MLRTRYREELLLKACLDAKQPFVVDNTNPTSEERARYIEPAKQAGFRVFGYYFDVKEWKNVSNEMNREEVPRMCRFRACCGRTSDYSCRTKMKDLTLYITCPSRQAGYFV